MNEADATKLGLSRRELLSHGGAISAAYALNPLVAFSTLPGNATDRIRETFDFGWKFQSGDHPDGQLRGLNDAAWQSLDLPHDWSIEGPFSEANKSEANLPTGVGWYRKRFRVPQESEGRKVTIEFDGVYMNSEVWINEHFLGKRPYGYVPFAYDLTPYLLHNGENVIAVKVDNSRQTNSRWYSGSGIYRHTWLLSTHPLHVAHWGVGITTPSVTSQRATIQVKTNVLNEGKEASSCALIASLLDDKGSVLQSVETSQAVPAGRRKRIYSAAYYQHTASLVSPRPSDVHRPNFRSARCKRCRPSRYAYRRSRSSLGSKAWFPVERRASQAEWRVPPP